MAVLRGGTSAALVKHGDSTDYSAWLLPAVDEALAQAGTTMGQVDLLAVSTGPGSFTGLRIGLTTVKAWAEVYGKPIVGVSRLEAMARSRETPAGFVAACYDAHRGQLFGGLYRDLFGRRTRVGDELVISPKEFIEFVNSQADGAVVTWISLDPELIQCQETLRRRMERGDAIFACAPELAPCIGSLSEERAARGEFTDPLALDANYVRRSDAEIFWKGPSTDER